MKAQDVLLLFPYSFFLQGFFDNKMPTLSFNIYIHMVIFNINVLSSGSALLHTSSKDQRWADFP